MRMRLVAAMLAALTPMLASAPAAHAAMNLLSTCAGKAALGAGGGALLGGVLAGKGAKTEGALLGAAVGGLGTYGVCKSLNASNTKKVDQAYRTAAASGQAYSTSWRGKSGREYMDVAKPVQDGASCRRMTATLMTPAAGSQYLPQETYCRGADGVWRAA